MRATVAAWRNLARISGLRLPSVRKVGQPTRCPRLLGWQVARNPGTPNGSKQQPRSAMSRVQPRIQSVLRMVMNESALLQKGYVQDATGDWHKPRESGSAPCLLFQLQVSALHRARRSGV